MTAQKPPELFDASYYAHNCGVPYQRNDHWLAFFGAIADSIVRTIQPRTVLDAGCALGFLVETLRQRGVEAFGRDISEHAIQHIHPDIQPYCTHGSITDPFPQHYHLVTCIEVVEHMPPREAELAIANICAHTDDVLFSSTPFDYKEATHLNVQPPEHWSLLFAEQGFFRDIDFDASFVTPWATRFRRRQEPIPRLVRDYERRFWLLWKENTDLRELLLEKRSHADAALHAELSHKEQAVVSMGAYIAELEELAHALVDEKEQFSQESSAYIHQLEQAVEQKNEHIAHLETIIKQLESGQAMRVLRTLQALKQQGIRTAMRTYRTIAQEAPPAERPVPAVRSTDSYQTWIAATEPGPDELAHQRRQTHAFAYRPLISFVTPVYNPSPQVLREMIESVCDQTYDHWLLCLADGGSTEPGVRQTLTEFAAQDPRVRVTFLERNMGISGNTNQALAQSEGDYIALLDHDDLLAPNMLYEVVHLLNRQPDTDIVYYDEDKVSEDGTIRRLPLFKPGRWSPDMLLSTNYLMHSVLRRSLVLEAGGFDSATDGAQDWDLLFRCVEKTQRIAHIPEVLYHWRQVATSAASDASIKIWAFDTQAQCFAGHLKRSGNEQARLTFPNLGTVRILWPTTPTRISLIIPTRDNAETVRGCLNALFARTTWHDYEIILVDMGSNQPETYRFYEELVHEPRIRLVDGANDNGKTTLPAALNHAVRLSSGDLLLFLHDDTAPLDDGADWLDELAGWAQRPQVGVVGAKLLRADGTIQHAGLVVGMNGFTHSLFDGEREGSFGAAGSTEWYRNCTAVSGACMMVRRDVFDTLGGFDESYQAGWFDTAFCIRAGQQGFRVVSTPFARLWHYEQGTLDAPFPPEDLLHAYAAALPYAREGDPFFTPNLSITHRCTTLTFPDRESREERLLHTLRTAGLVEASQPTVAPTPALPLLDTTASQHPCILFITGGLALRDAPPISAMLATAFAASGCHVTVLSPTEGPLRRIYNEAGIEVVVEPAIHHDARIIFALISEHQAVVADTAAAWHAVYAARAAQCPFVWWLPDTRQSVHLARTNERIAQALATTESVVVPTHAAAKTFALWCRPGVVHTLPIGIDPREGAAYINTVRREPGKFYVVCLAPVEPRSGQDILVRSAESLPDEMRPAVEYYLAGTILDWGFHKDLSRLMRFKEQVRFVGEVSRGRAISYLQAADVVVFPTRDDEFSPFLAEAMCYGKAIIATNTGGAADVIEHGENGLLVNVGDYAQIGKYLEQLYHNTEQRKEMGSNARAYFQQHLTMRQVGQEILLSIKRAMAPERANRRNETR